MRRRSNILFSYLLQIMNYGAPISNQGTLHRLKFHTPFAFLRKHSETKSEMSQIYGDAAQSLHKNPRLLHPNGEDVCTENILRGASSTPSSDSSQESQRSSVPH